MPKKPKGHTRPPRPLRPGGKTPADPPPNMVAFAIEHLREHTATATVNEIMKVFGKCRRTGWTVVTEAQTRIDEDKTIIVEAARVKIREGRRLDRIADSAEDAEDYQAAIAASREISKLFGAHAAKKIQVTQVSVSIQMRAIVGILDEAGLAALEVLTTQIEAAKAAGRLPETPLLPAASEEVIDDAEVEEQN